MAFARFLACVAIAGGASPRRMPAANTMLAAQTLLLAATAAGLSSCPMEGFDGRRVRRALRIPRRYSIPLVVAVGHPTPLARDDPVATKRFALEEVAFGDAFGEPLLAAASG